MSKVTKSNVLSAKNLLAASFITAGVLTVAAYLLSPSSFYQSSGADAMQKAVCNNRYNPDITPSNFTTEVTNQFLALPPGRKLVYEGDTEDGREKIEITISKPLETKVVSGVTTLVYRDRVWIDADDDGKFETNELHEDVKDYIAQRKDTKDIWYFGEDVNYYEDGELISHDGTWLAGRDGAKPGIFVKHDPKRGESFLQECWKGEAEDTVDVLSVNAEVKTKLGKFKNCVKTYDWNPNDPESREHKFYCTVNINGKAVSAKVLQVDLETGNRIELISASEIKSSTATPKPEDDDEDDDD